MKAIASSIHIIGGGNRRNSGRGNVFRWFFYGGRSGAAASGTTHGPAAARWTGGFSPSVRTALSPTRFFFLELELRRGLLFRFRSISRQDQRPRPVNGEAFSVSLLKMHALHRGWDLRILCLRLLRLLLNQGHTPDLFDTSKSKSVSPMLLSPRCAPPSPRLAFPPRARTEISSSEPRQLVRAMRDQRGRQQKRQRARQWTSAIFHGSRSGGATSGNHARGPAAEALQEGVSTTWTWRTQRRRQQQRRRATATTNQLVIGIKNQRQHWKSGIEELDGIQMMKAC